MKILAFMALAAAAVAGSAPARSAPGKAFPFAIEHKTLPNGLQVWAVHYDSPGLIAYYTVVRTGSRNEVEAGHTGFAHFFEHMMFRGTERFPAEKYIAIAKEMGADSNAFTSDDLTVFHLLAGKESLPRLVEIEADRFQHLKYTEPAFQKEARAVLGEYNVGSSSPVQPLEEKIRDLAFSAHTYKHTTIGFLKDVEDMPNQYAYSRQFFDRYYRPDNVQVVVAGDVESAELFRLAQKEYGGWARGPERPAVPAEPAQAKEQRATIEWKSETLPILFEGFHAPAFSSTSKDGPALDVLSELLFSDRAPLHKRLTLEEQKVETLEGGLDAHRDPYLYTIFARVKNLSDVAQVERAVGDEITRIAANPPDARLVAETVSHIRYAFAGSLNRPDRVAQTAAYQISLSGDIESLNAYYALFDSITPEDVSAAARKYFRPENRTVVTLASAQGEKK